MHYSGSRENVIVSVMHSLPHAAQRKVQNPLVDVDGLQARRPHHRQVLAVGET
jgi:hypothetical protein